MRTYPRNTPQAAARIVTLAMLADAVISRLELDALDRSGAHRQLGLQAADWDAVVHDFCDDLRDAAQLTWQDGCRIDPRTLAELMAEVDDRELRLKVLRLCVSVVEADGHVGEGEAIVLEAMVEQWGLHREMLQPALKSVRASTPGKPGHATCPTTSS